MDERSIGVPQDDVLSGADGASNSRSRPIRASRPVAPPGWPRSCMSVLQGDTLMAVTLKPLSEQVLVITGASSGIGLVTARMAAEKGAKGLVLAARSDQTLQELVNEINAKG